MFLCSKELRCLVSEHFTRQINTNLVRYFVLTHRPHVFFAKYKFSKRKSKHQLQREQLKN